MKKLNLENNTEEHKNKKRFFGEFFTPLDFTKKSIEYIYEIIDKEELIKGNYRIWDMAGGIGNLEYYLPKECHKYLYISTLYNDDVETLKKNFQYANCFQYDYLNDDVESLFNFIESDNAKKNKYEKLPLQLTNELQNKKVKWLIFINPPYATSQTAGTNSKSKKNVSATKIRNVMHKYLLGTASRELYIQFLFRIYFEFLGLNTKLAIFSKINYINAGNSEKFREKYFNFLFLKGFVFSSSEFSETSKISPFPVVFSIWDLNKNVNLKNQNIILDTLSNNTKIIGTKIIKAVSSKYFLNNWVKREKCKNILPPLSSAIKVVHKKIDIRDRVCDGFIASLMSCGNDLQKNNLTAILSAPQASAGAMSITKNNFEKCVIIHTVRRITKINWLNSSDQFLQPSKKLSEDFIVDCVVWTLFSKSNQTSSIENIFYKEKTYNIINEFFPFTIEYLIKEIKNLNIDSELLKKINSDNNKDRFVALWLKEKILDKKLSRESEKLLDSGKLLYKSFFENFKNINKEKYLITNFDVGFFQIRKSLEEVNLSKELIKEVEKNHLVLGEKLLKLIYEYEFIMK